MNVLVVGGGAREHALAWKLAQSPRCTRLYCAPGNYGTGLLAENLPVAANDIDGLLNSAQERGIDLTVVGPEEPLARGIVDRFRERGLAIVGPTRAAARIESSKWWAKEIMRETGVPTGRAARFTDPAAAREYLDTTAYPAVLKADGLAAGKGVAIVHDRAAADEAVRAFMEEGALGAPVETLLVEEFLEGTEVSLLALTDGDTVLPLLPACDYKRVGDGDAGPNTGGMGVYAPTRLLDAAAAAALTKRILLPVVKRMARKGAPYSGVLYSGLILTARGPQVLEFNCRFGDPETEVILPLLRSDLLDTLVALTEGRLRDVALDWDDGAAVGVVLASGGYPGPYETGLPIAGLDALDPDALVFHAGTAAGPGGGPVTAGGRVLTVVGRGPTLATARDRAYADAARIAFAGRHLRHDIALREI
ncbi:MAG TPA: phosphoribosylamine--glycine ligase [Thermomicrobiales bacterium]|nr:phosphoribosylamine--glycine ligase [Thermomicrobiales bacterium]